MADDCGFVGYSPGAAQATYLKAKGSSLEQETEEALEIAQQRAEEAAGVALEKQQIMEENLKRQAEYRRVSLHPKSSYSG